MISEFKYPINLYKEIGSDINYTNYLNNLYGDSSIKDELTHINSFFYSNIMNTKNIFMRYRIYLFDYIYPGSVNNLEYVDNRPLVFTFTDNNGIITGINLNFIPQPIFVNFLQIYLKFFENRIISDIESEIDKTISIFDNKSYKLFAEIINNEMKYIYKAVRTWDKKYILNDSIKVVRIRDYSYLFMYDNYLNTIKGLPPKYIQSLIIKG